MSASSAEDIVTPKHFERNRRDSAAPVTISHCCDEVNGDMEIPKPWRENFINCRICKRSLVVFLTEHFLKYTPQHIQDGQILLLAGGFEGETRPGLSARKRLL